MQEVCRRLSDAWDMSGYTMAAMAHETGLSETTLRRIRSGDSGINFTTAAALARVLGVSLDDLAGLEVPAAAKPAEPDSRAQLVERQGCPDACLTRKTLSHAITQIETQREIYLDQIREERQRNEQALRYKNCWIVVLTVLLLGFVGLIVWLLAVDQHRPAAGIIRYPSVEDLLASLDEAGYTIIPPED